MFKLKNLDFYWNEINQKELSSRYKINKPKKEINYFFIYSYDKLGSKLEKNIVYYFSDSNGLKQAFLIFYNH